MNIMTKQIIIKATNILNAKDKRYVFSTYESILDSIFDFDSASNLEFSKDINSFYISFDLKVCKSGDLLWILVKEFLSTIKQTEEYVELEITEIEQATIGITYKLFKYIPNSMNDDDRLQ